MDELIEQVYEVDDGQLTAYTGNYSEYLKQREENHERAMMAYKNQQREIEQIQDFIDKFRSVASKAAQAQSREKQLAKMDKLDKPKPLRKAFRFNFPQPARSGQRVIALTGIHQAYGEKKVYENLDLDVERGERTALIGPNGSGKSTLLKLVAGVLLPDEGEVRVHGGVAPLIEITGGFVGDLTVRENVRLTAGLHGMSRAEVSRRFDGIIDFAELHESIDTPYKHLSNGMKVRLAFSVVSQLEEPILLVDEVLAVGDKAFREKCYRRIDELLAEGRTLFFVSHNEKDLRRFCTRGLYLDKGALAMDAPLADVLDRYNADYNAG
jgi:ABC-2 type transport system ATP-binding protein